MFNKENEIKDWKERVVLDNLLNCLETINGVNAEIGINESKIGVNIQVEYKDSLVLISVVRIDSKKKVVKLILMPPSTANDLNQVTELGRLISSSLDRKMGIYSTVGAYPSDDGLFIQWEYKDNGFTNEHYDLYKHIDTYIKNTPIFKDDFIMLSDLNLLRIECNPFGDRAPLSIILADKILNNKEQFLLNKILKKIEEYSLLFSFILEKDEVLSTINLVRNDKELGYHSDALANTFINLYKFNNKDN